METLPPQIQDFLKMFGDVFFSKFEPCVQGTTSQPFFRRISDETVVPSVEPRGISVPLPSRLCAFVQHFPPTTEFKIGHWTILSEHEISDRRTIFCKANQNRMIDFAVTYEGMGHVGVASYDPVSDLVIRDHDGGSNGWDRAKNFARRCGTNVETLDKQSFDAWCRDVLSEIESPT